MRKHLLIYFLFFTACSQIPLIENGSERSTEISLDEAIKNLVHFSAMLDSESSIQTKVSNMRTSEVIEINPSMIRASTRSIPGIGEDETLFYLINFEGNSGFAILSADTRIKTPVLALTEKGNLTESLQLSLINNENDEELSLFLKNLISDYVISESERLVSLTRDGSPDDGESEPGENPEGDLGGSTGGGQALHNIAPLFPNWWNQDTPFNDLCISSGDTCKAGCLPLSVSMSLARVFYDNNASVTMGSHHFDFSNIVNIWYRNGLYIHDTLTNEEKAEVALFVKNNGVLMQASYGVNRTGATMANAAACLRLYGFSSATVNNGYDLNNVINMLEQGKPVVFSGFHSLLAVHGHSWIIDGISQSYDNNNLITLLHCNWGCGGCANGYYISGAMNSSTGPYSAGQYDYPNNPGQLESDYNYRMKYITY